MPIMNENSIGTWIFQQKKNHMDQIYRFDVPAVMVGDRHDFVSDGNFSCHDMNVASSHERVMSEYSPRGSFFNKFFLILKFLDWSCIDLIWVDSLTTVRLHPPEFRHVMS